MSKCEHPSHDRQGWDIRGSAQLERIEWCPRCGATRVLRNMVSGHDSAPSGQDWGDWHEPERLPLAVILCCPCCGARHIDKGEYAKKRHKSHTCQKCGVTWRASHEPTVGVDFLPGTQDGES